MLETYPTEITVSPGEAAPVDDPPVVESRPALRAIPPEAPLPMPEQSF
jgi:hypothetical protein